MVQLKLELSNPLGSGGSGAFTALETTTVLSVMTVANNPNRSLVTCRDTHEYLIQVAPDVLYTALGWNPQEPPKADV